MPTRDSRDLVLAVIRHEQFISHVVLFCFMMAASWIDIDEMTIPDGVTIPGTLAGLVIVTLWPYALLPESPKIPNGRFGLPMANSVWLTSPDEVLPPTEDPVARLCSLLGLGHIPRGEASAATDEPLAPVQFLMPWQSPLCMGWGAWRRPLRFFGAGA